MVIVFLGFPVWRSLASMMAQRSIQAAIREVLVLQVQARPLPVGNIIKGKHSRVSVRPRKRTPHLEIVLVETFINFPMAFNPVITKPGRLRRSRMACSSSVNPIGVEGFPFFL